MEWLGLVAAIVGIVAGILSIIQFILKPFLHKRKIFVEFSKIYESWKNSNHNFKYLFENENDFLKLISHKKKLKNLSDEKLAFILLNSIKFCDEMRYWFEKNRNNREAVRQTIIFLDGRAGWRPIWRSAFLLQNINSVIIDDVLKEIPDKIKEDERIKFALETIKNKSVKEYLSKVAQLDDDKEHKDKARKVLDEIKRFELEDK